LPVPLDRVAGHVEGSVVDEELRELLVGLVTPVVEEHAAELVDLEVAGARNSRIIRLLVHKDPAISVELCGAISREVGDLLDIDDPVTGHYRLEVTSPGLGRPLQTDRDLARAVGRGIKVVMTTGHTHQGVLLRWDETNIAVSPAGSSEAELTLSREVIAKATIVPAL
jgi:ribosome maturation factor RimP